jgi:hypothetical protein
MRVTGADFPGNPPDDIIPRERPSLLGEMCLKKDMEEKVTQFLPNSHIVAVLNGLEQLIRLFKKERCE